MCVGTVPPCCCWVCATVSVWNCSTIGFGGAHVIVYNKIFFWRRPINLLVLRDVFGVLDSFHEQYMPSEFIFGCMFCTYRLFSFYDKTFPSIGVYFADRMKLCEKKTSQLHLLYTFADQTWQLQAKLSSSKESVGAAKFGHGAAKFGWSC